MSEFWALCAVASCVKLLFLPSYKSTDFDVHRNWLAITHSLPVRKWYFEDTSEWTLDYPPFFAWFEFALSQIAVYFDPEMLKVENVNYRSEMTVIFQKLSVIVTDLLYFYAVKSFYEVALKQKKKVEYYTNHLFHNPYFIQAVLLITNFGLFIVDHIHFQYNGFLSGLLLLSIVRIYQGRHLSAAFWFTVLLNFKHIYLYIAPAYFVYLLRCYVFQSTADGHLNWRSLSIVRLMGLGIIVVSVFTVSFGPFAILHQVPQVLSRLFPFKRGLCHAYWAPNFWALYNVADKGAAFVGSKWNLLPNPVNQTASMTGGLVQEFDHTVLPSIKPVVTLVCTVLAMLPSLLLLWSRPRGPQSFVRSIVLCAFSSFMFGWHVHEKAILLIVIPLSLLVLEKRDAQVYLLLSTIGHYSLFPLLFTQFETPIKVFLLMLSSLYTLLSLSEVHRSSGSCTRLPLLNTGESLYLLGIIPLELYNSVVHPVLGHSVKYPFLPLLMTSVYCAIGVTYCWFRFLWITYTDRSKLKQM